MYIQAQQKNVNLHKRIAIKSTHILVFSVQLQDHVEIIICMLTMKQYLFECYLYWVMRLPNPFHFIGHCCHLDESLCFRRGCVGIIGFANKNLNKKIWLVSRFHDPSLVSMNSLIWGDRCLCGHYIKNICDCDCGECNGDRRLEFSFMIRLNNNHHLTCGGLYLFYTLFIYKKHANTLIHESLIKNNIRKIPSAKVN